MKNILLVGERYSTNLGDGVIYQTVERMIRADIPDAVIHGLDLSGRVTYSDDTDWLLSFSDALIAKYISSDIARARLVKKQLRLLLKRHQIDVIVFVGGQLFIDYFIRAIDVVVREADRMDIPVIFNACGFGESSASHSAKIISILSRSVVKHISTRDAVGEILPKKLHNGVVPTRVMDPVVELGKYWRVTRRQGGNGVVRVGINIMSPWTTHRSNPEVGNAYMKTLLLDIIAYCESNGFRWEIYSNGAGEDIGYIMGACRELGIDAAAIALSPQIPEQLVTQIASYDIIVGFRMHTHIIAHALDIPTIGFLWDEKLLRYAEQVGLCPQFLPLDANGHAVCGALEKTMKRKPQVRIRRQVQFSSDFLIASLGRVLK
ncbi:MAG: polysaccharide pyruvyl transferase family protein [Candidatus Saccharibacteria bacterium]|nr:polysaccharide pyruvyl transferase family protein [Candidatus Saccharibacteria bacterium]